MKDFLYGQVCQEDPSSNKYFLSLLLHVTKPSPRVQAIGRKVKEYLHTICMPNFREFPKLVYWYNYSPRLLIGMLRKKVSSGVLMSRL